MTGRERLRRWRTAIAGVALAGLIAPVLAVSQATPADAAVPTPKFVRTIGGSGRPGVFSWGVQHNPVTNEILVADYLHFKVRRYDMNGNHLGDFWRDDPFGQPYTIGVDHNDGSIYVAELRDNPISTGIAKYDAQGNFLYAARGLLAGAPERETWTDGVITTGSTSLTSATARFGNSDIGKKVVAPGVPEGTTIVSRTTTTAVMSQAATADDAALTFVLDPFPVASVPSGSNPASFRAFYTVWMTVEEDTGDIFVLDSHYQNYVGERPRVLHLRFDDATQGVTTVDAWAAVAADTPVPDNGDDVDDPNECTNPVGCDPRMYGIDIVTDPGGPTDDMIYVTDAYNRRSYRFSKAPTGVLLDGTPSHHIDTFGLGQNGGDQRGIVVNEELNRVYSVDAENSQVDVFTMGTATTPPTFVNSFSSEGNGPGQFTGGGRAIDVDSDGNVWVADFGGFETEKFSPTGTPLLSAPDPARRPPVGLLGQPRDVAIDQETGEIWVADTWNQRFQRFSATGVPMGTWGERGPGGPFNSNYPRHIQIQPANTAAMPGPNHPKRIWISQERGHHVQVYNYPTTPGGSPTYVVQVGEIGQDNVEEGHFRWPVDIEFFTHSDGTEIAVIGDRMASSVKFFNANTFQEILNPDAYLPEDDPDYDDAENGAPMIERLNHGIAVDPATNHVYVLSMNTQNPNSSSNGRVYVYDENGQPVENWVDGNGNPINWFAGFGTAPGLMRYPVDGVIHDGLLYVADESTSRVNIFGLDGSFQGRFGSTYGSNIYDFKGPVGVDIDHARGLLYVTDSFNDRIQVFDVNAARQWEVTAPGVPVVATPAQQSNLPLAPVTFTGTATDNVAVGHVEIAVQDADTGLWWNALNQSWEGARTTALAAWSGADGTTVDFRWTFLGVSAQGRYIAELSTKDHNANQSQATVRTFAMPGATPPVPPDAPVLDIERPVAVQDTPTPNQVFPRAPVGFSGTATDNVGVTTVKIAIKNLDNGRWLTNPNSSSTSTNGAFGTGFAWYDAVLDNPGGTSTGWTWTWPTPISSGGNFQTLVEARDEAGNIAANRPQVPFSTTSQIPEAIAPETVLTTPAPGTTTDTTPVVISGEATDDTSVSSVQLGIQRSDTGEWWTGGTWSATAATVAATLATPNTPSSTWSYDFTPAVAASFTVTATAVDVSGNVDASPATTDVTVTAGGADVIDPDATITAPTSDEALPAGPVTFTGTATDNVGVSAVELAVRNRTTLDWWNGTGWSSQFEWFSPPATLSNPGATSTDWSLVWNPPADGGSFLVQARAADTTGNFDQLRPSVDFSVAGGFVDTVDPDTVITEPTPGTEVQEGQVVLSGTASDNASVDTVLLTIQRADTGQYWTATTWVDQEWSFAATLSQPDAASTGWTYSFAVSEETTYTVSAVAVDGAGNTDTTPATTSFVLEGEVVEDTADPNGTVTTPTGGQVFTTSPIAMAGDASDDIGVTTVRVAIRDNATLTWWNGTVWTSFYSSVNAVLADPGAPSTAWSLDFAPTGGTSYGMQVVAVDAAGKVDPTKPWVSFTYAAGGVVDTEAPDATVASPTNGQVLNTSPVAITGSATDDVAVAAVRVAIRNNATLQWWGASGWQAGYTTTDAVLTDPGATSTTWSLDWEPPAAGSFGMQVVAVDATGKVDPSKPWVPFSYTEGGADTEAPNGTVSSPTNGQVLSGPPVTLTGSATDDVAVSVVRVAVRNNTTLQWWGASGWQAGYATTNAVLTDPDSTSTTWSLEFAPPAGGAYGMQVIAVDGTGKVDPTKPWVPFQIS